MNIELIVWNEVFCKKDKKKLRHKQESEVDSSLFCIVNQIKLITFVRGRDRTSDDFDVKVAMQTNGKWLGGVIFWTFSLEYHQHQIHYTRWSDVMILEWIGRVSILV